MPAQPTASAVLEQTSWSQQAKDLCPRHNGLDQPSLVALRTQWLEETIRFVLGVYHKMPWGDPEPGQAYDVCIPVCHREDAYGLPREMEPSCVAASLVRARRVAFPLYDGQPRTRVHLSATTPSPLAWGAFLLGDNDAEGAGGAYAPDLHAWIDSRDLLEAANLPVALEIYMTLAKETLAHSAPLPWSISEASGLWRSALALSA